MNSEVQNDTETMDPQSRALLASLEECQETCQVSLMHSLDEGGDFVEMSHIRWLLDCADTCRLAINFFLRDSEYAGDVISLCSLICEDCAESCAKFFNDAHMVACAEVCRNCAKACKDMILEEEEIVDR